MVTTPSLFAARRRRLLERLERGVAVFPAAPVTIRSNDVEHEFRQDSDLHYLTGFGEPGAAAVLTTDGARTRFVMFVRPREPEREIWTGRRAGPEGALRELGCDEAYPIGELEERLPGLLENAPRLLYRLDRYPAFDRSVLGALARVRQRDRAGVSPPLQIVDPAGLLHEMRLAKTADELERMRRACAITCEAHRAALAVCRPGVREYEIEAAIEYVFRKHGSAGPAYPTIVGAGENATVLHYTANQGEAGPRDLVLVDAGCEWDGYCADVTRTFPASGRFEGPGRDLYEIVLEAQSAAIECVRPDVPYDAAHEAALRVLTGGLVHLGLLEGEADGLIEQGSYRRFYPHRTSHWLGLDVHDVGSYHSEGSPRRLEPGMVLTVEPGLYVQPDDVEAPAAFRGIGVRIEDDVLVTADGHEVLTSAAPKGVRELEEALGAAAGPETIPAP